MTKASVLSADEALRFLEWLDPVGLHNLVAIDPVSGAVEAFGFRFGGEDFGRGATDARAWIDGRNGKANVYFSINAPSGAARIDTKLRRDEIGAVRAFHVDLDEVPDGYAWGDPAEDCAPSAVIDSGNGLWGFWKLAEPIPVEDVAQLEAQNRALTAKFGGDTVATNLDRIARLPGTLNIPNKAKRAKGRTETVARIGHMSKIAYRPEQVAAWCPPAPPHAELQRQDQTPIAELDTPANVAKAARWLLQDAEQAVEGDGGDAATFRVAARLKDFGVSREVAFDLLLDCWNEDKALPPWPAAELLTKVRNAYQHGTAAPGRNAPALAESEFEAVEIDSAAAPKPPKRQMKAELFGDITEDFAQAPNYLIEDWYDQESMVVTYGESNSGKTHVVLDQALAIAAGRQWAGKKVKQGLVVYVAAEGGRGVRRRVMAHRLFRPEHKDLPFGLVAWPINLMNAQADTKALVAHVKALEAQTGQKCVMVVIDTLSRALAGGDENSSSDMGAFVKRCDEIRFATGAALHVIHHAGKNTAKGARGHSLLRAAVDTEIEIENNAITSRKQRDMEGSAELRFDYTPVLLGVRADGSEVRSVVLNVWQTSEFDVNLTPAAQKVLERFEEITRQKLQETPNVLSPKVTPKELMALGESATTVERSLGELVGEGSIVKVKRGLYKLAYSPKPS